jgi:hypothetical protein
MATLSRELRNALERAVLAARLQAETGARKALDQLAVGHHEPWPTMTSDQQRLRRRLRAHGRQLGDRLENGGAQGMARLVTECAYEQWHRMLFARFLAECGLLFEPASGVAVSVEECKELARERGDDWLSVASTFAQDMLPQIFRRDDPVLEVAFPLEHRQPLERLLADLPADVFRADDSLGWVYQFWQSEEKDRVNRSGEKIGANTLSPVTQLFTEDYMVEFLLHNTIGAWWAGKLGPIHAETEEDARAASALAIKHGLTINWTYLRFAQNHQTKTWSPAAGAFAAWPRVAKLITLLDPCVGSGHFIVFALPLLARIRMEEEGLSAKHAIHSALRDNLFCLELDERCAQIAAFNVALTAWKLGGYQSLPPLQVACSGIAPGASEKDWVSFATGDDRLQRGMERLHALFKDAPELGSLIDPRAQSGNLVDADFGELQPLLDKALTQEAGDDTTHEVAVTARGLARAAEILSGQFTLVATNVPYLGRGKQDGPLRRHCETVYPEAKADLATCFIERCLTVCKPFGTIALVSPQNWWFSPGYQAFRNNLLSRDALNFLVTLGEEAWQSFGDRGPVASLVIASRARPTGSESIAAIDALPRKPLEAKIRELESGAVLLLAQRDLIANPDSRLAFDRIDSRNLLSKWCESWQGLVTTDNPRFMLCFWEVWGSDWVPFTSSPAKTRLYGGREHVLLWMNGDGPLQGEGKAHNFPPRSALGRKGVLVSQVRSLSGTIYTGEVFAHGSSPIIPSDESILPALWCFISSPEYRAAVRNIDKKLAVTNSTLLKVEFDLPHWREVAASEYPRGLPIPGSSDPTQWLFNGQPNGSDHSLQVAVARLLGYRWPRDNGGAFLGCPDLDPDSLDSFADRDGIVCLPATKGEERATARLRSLLAAAFGTEWNASKLDALLTQVGCSGRTLDDWLENEFFEQHCALFHQRPFIWHVWDGRQDGFGALVNYHSLTKTTLEKLTYAYLGEWVSRQEAAVLGGESGSDARLVAAKQLQSELKKILEGEPPYDIFIRWKPVAKQAIGWEPDLNDGIRANIRPFMMATDLGKKGAGILRAKPNIKWDKDRGKELARAKEEYPWFWGWDGKTTDFSGTPNFDGNRWNNLHYSREVKMTARKQSRQS